MAKARAALVAGALGVVAIGAIALSSRKAKASPASLPLDGEPVPGGGPLPSDEGAPLPTTPAKGVIEAPTTGDTERVRQGIEGILAAMPGATLEQFVLGSLDNAASIVAAEGPEAVFAVYEPDDLAAIYQSAFLLGTTEDRDVADNLMIDLEFPAGQGFSDIPTGRSIWLDQADYFDGEDRLRPVVSTFLSAQQGGFA